MSSKDREKDIFVAASPPIASLGLALSYWFAWLSQGGPQHPKHQAWEHPIIVCIVHYAVVTTIGLSTHDWLIETVYYEGQTCLSPTTKRICHYVALWLMLYASFLLTWRIFFRKEPNPEVEYTPPQTVLYEYCWLCNVTLLQSALALSTNRPVLAAAYCVTVGIDQLLWYIDAISYAWSRKFAVGVAKYLLWPSNANWSCRITCTHHLWTLPLVLSCTRGLHPASYPLSLVAMCTNVLLSRWMTPSHVRSSFNTNSKYLNVNVSHELWKDISFQCLQINRDGPPATVYLVRLLWRWQAFNTIVFAFLYKACSMIFPGPVPVC